MAYTTILSPDEENRIIQEQLQKILMDDGLKYLKLTIYLKQEYREGKTEFRIAFQSQNHFIIHPLHKDGKTLDVKI